ncbi:COX15/CtaA family protein [Radiobacillus sp. PE A8.2]|uniref:COX15/CtaA family protein n=1 Tax=Radiobacillus sp. PE A8.2 TaxID=3380349 RepID=UPI00388F80D6
MRFRFARFTTVLTILALVLGNLVVATKAGDACGTDWPKCNGNFIPSFTDYKVLIEYSHRLFTGCLGFVILINAIVAWRKSETGLLTVKILSITSVMLLLLQGSIGGMNVLLGTPPGFTTFDVTVSLVLLISIILLEVALDRKSEFDGQEKWKVTNQYGVIFKPALVVFSLYFIEVLIGAFFKHSGASKIASNIVVHESLIESFTFSQFIYSIHGIYNTIILITAGLILFLSTRNGLLVKESVVFFLLVITNGLTGYITQLAYISDLSSSVHMIIVILTVAQGAYLVGRSYFGTFLATS